MTAKVILSDIAGLTRAAPLSRRAFHGGLQRRRRGLYARGGTRPRRAITTSAEGLSAGTATVKVAGGEMPVYFARPEGVKPPVILVAMEIFGLHEYIKDVTRRLAKLGAFAIAPDTYFRMGDLTKIGSIPQLLPLVNAKSDAELFADLDATVAFAKAQGGDANRLGIVGFCRGGRTVWLYAGHNPALKAGVSFYGSLMDPPSEAMPKNAFDLADAVKAPVLGLYGAEDQGIPRSGAANGGEAESRRQDRRVQDLSGRPAWIFRRLPRQLPQGGGRGRLAPGDRLVQDLWRAGLNAASAVRHTAPPQKDRIKCGISAGYGR